MSATHRPDPLRGIPLEALRGFEAAARVLNSARGRLRRPFGRDVAR